MNKFTNLLLFLSLLFIFNKSFSQEPTTQVSNFQITDATIHSISLSWTRGNGDSVIIVAREGGVTADPADGTGYTANTVYGNGSVIIGFHSTNNYVVYKGTGTSVTITGLTEETSCEFYAYEFNYNTGNEDYNVSSTGNHADQTTAPLTQSYSLSFSSVETTSMRIDWTNGTGEGRIVAVKEGTQGTITNPTFGKTYSASSNWSSKGDQLGSSGYYVVYNGNGNTISLSNLAKGSNYWVQVFDYEINSTDTAYNTNTATDNPKNQATIDDAPTSQATNIVFSNIAKTSLTLEWTRGNGSYCLVVAEANGDVNSPSDGTDYTADAAFGSGNSISGTGTSYVIYKGTGTTVDVTNLTEGTSYTFKVFEYNNTGSNIKYLISNGTNNPNSTTTLKSEPTTQTQTISFSSLQTTQVTVNISGGNGDNHLVLIKEASAVNAIPTDGTEYTGNTSFGSGTEIGTGNFVVSAGTTTSFTVTNLKQNTRYYFKVYDYNNTGSNTNYKTDGFGSGNPADTITPKSAPTTQALNLSFSNITTSSFNVTWERGNGDSVIIVIKQGSSLTETPSNGTSYNPDPTYGSGETIATGCYVVYTGTGTAVSITGLSSETQYTVKAFEFNNEEPYTDYLTSTATNNPVSKYSVATEPGTQAKNITFSNIQSSSVSLSWDVGDGVSRLVLAHQGAAIDANPTDGFVYSASATFGSGDEIGTGNFVVYAGTGSGVTVTNLLANTTYYFKVYEYNGTNDALNYLISNGTSGNPSSQTTAQGKPNTQASDILFSSIGTTSYTVSWNSNDDGDSVLVVGKVGSSLTELPTDGTTYSASSAFGSGDIIATGCYVVYKGDGSSISVTNLSSNTEYTFKVFSYNNISGNEYYNDDNATNNPLSRYTLADEPTQSSNITASNITATQLNLSFSSGNGTNKIILAHEGSAVSSDPVDGTDYTASSNFGEGTEIGSGNFVVYSSNGTSTTITNLKQNTTYYFKVYDYNGTATSSNFLTTGTGNTVNATTVKAEPTSQATDITFSNLATTSYTAGWTRGDAANTGVIIVAKQGSAVSNVPQDGTTYSANAAFGSGNELSSGSGEYVVYNGTGTSVDITSLTVGTEYYLRAFEYNNTGSNIDYLTTTADGNPNSQFTLSSEPTTQVTHFTISTISSNSLGLTWTNGNGTGRIILAKQTETNPSFPDPSDGITYNANTSFGDGSEIGTGFYVVYAGTGNTATITNLQGNTKYYFKIYEYNDNGAINYMLTNAPVAQANTNQKAAPTVQASSINFTNLNTTSFTINWTKGDGEKRLVAIREGGQGTIINPTDGNTYTASTDWSSKGTQLGSSGYYTVYSDTGATVSITNLSVNTEYWIQIFEYNNIPGSEKYFTSTATDNPNSQYTLKTAPTTTATGITLSDITSTSIKVLWTNGTTGDNRIVIARENSTTNVTPSDFTAYTANASFGSGDITGTGNYVVYNGTGSTVTVTNLTESKSYTFIVYEYNNSGSNAIYNTTITTDVNSKSGTTLGAITWQGNSSTDWNTGSNWSSGSVPTSSVSVIIPNTTNKPVIGSNESYTIEKLTINAGGALTINTGATLSVSGDVLLKSPSDNGTAGQIVVKGSGSLSVSGTSKMERYYPSTSNWRLVSAPITSPSITTWSGYYVNAYNESDAGWDHLNSNSSISVMQGVSVLNSSGSNTLTFSGTFNTGSLSINVTNSSPGDDNYGWSIVGNPYPCALDWTSSTGISFSNVDATAYIYNASAGSYITCNQSSCTPYMLPIIEAGQGFFIHATNNGSLTFNNDARIVSSQTFRKSAKLSFPLIRLSADNGIYTSETLVMFNDEATDDFDSKFDAYKLLSTNDTIADIYTLLSDETYLAINALNTDLLNSLPDDGLIIPVGLTKGVSGSVTISASAIENISDNIYIYLYDANTDKYINLRKNNYDLYVSAQVDNRLQLIITTNALSVEEKNNSFDVLIYVNNNSAFVKSQIFESNTGIIQVYDITGKLILTKTTDNSKVQKFEINRQGTYIIKVIVGNKVINQKVIAK